jgi:hypothetical protein
MSQARAKAVNHSDLDGGRRGELLKRIVAHISPLAWSTYPYGFRWH